MAWRRTITLAVVAVVLGAGPALGYVGAPGFVAGRVYDQNFPDPHVLFDPGTGSYYAYATNTGGSQLPIMQSDDGVTWTAKADRFTPPAWAARVDGGVEVWAPSVHQLPSGHWRAYYSIRERNGSQNRYCISVAEGSGPTGPFVDRSSGPLTCGYGAAGAIDPYLHIDSRDRLWLLWKVEDHRSVEVADDDVHFPMLPAEIEEREQQAADGEPPPLRRLPAASDAIWSQRLDDTGLAYHQPEDDEEPRSTAAILLTGTTNWEGRVVESPAMFVAGGRLHLLYSGNRWESHEYATGWATCSSPSGPCTRRGGSPLLAHGGEVNGPGGASVYVDRADDLRIAYHAWNAPYVSYPSYPACDVDHDGVCADEGQRFLHIDLLCSLPSGNLHVGVPAGWSFCDVDPSVWFGEGVGWMAETGVTTGVSEGRFAPETGLTRAQAVTFLWRWAGEPTTDAAHGFTDVEAWRYYTEAVAWAAAEGVTKGTTATTFSPDDPVDRAQIATLLHRVSGLADPQKPSPFADVPVDVFYTEAVAWAAETGVTTGYTATEFRPHEPATRAQFATMLCRFSRVPASENATIAAATETCA